jgi:predicted CXXCH cytochrome family protein
MKTKTIYLFILILIPLTTLLTQCFNSDKEKKDPRDAVFAGSEKCAKCHSDIYNSYLHTAHFQTSAPASIHNIHGSFAAGKNVFNFNSHLKVVMEKRKDGLYQVAYLDGKQTEAHRFDITFGGNKAETYLYWKNKQLFQLPMSYFDALQSWTNSPGYAYDHPDYDRPIQRRCFECHSSYIKEIPQENVSLQKREIDFDPKSVIYGIDCERCHGPAANHVNYHTAYPEEKKARYIVKFSSLTRDQKLDACAVCHSSSKDIFQVSSFKFKMGDTLAKFKEPHFLTQNIDPAKLDVHGNQNTLLASSKCFLMSNMDCTTCHNVHVKENPNLVIYSQLCVKCHNEANHNFCKMAPKLGALIKNNCIDCHMPLKPSNVIGIASSAGKKEIPYMVRTHRIAIYPEETKKILTFMNAKSSTMNRQ